MVTTGYTFTNPFIMHYLHIFYVKCMNIVVVNAVVLKPFGYMITF